MLKLLLLAFLSTAHAKEAFVPPDEELWRNMSQAFANLSMPATAHQQVQAIMQQVEREAKARAAAKKIPAPPEPKK